MNYMASISSASVVREYTYYRSGMRLIVHVEYRVCPNNPMDNGIESAGMDSPPVSEVRYYGTLMLTAHDSRGAVVGQQPFIFYIADAHSIAEAFFLYEEAGKKAIQEEQRKPNIVVPGRQHKHL